jgi:ribonuclease D
MKINFINSAEDFNLVEKSFLKSKRICIDTEFVRENTYYPILSLVQLNINNEIFILDCYNKENLLKKLTNILIDNDILKIFHDCEQDIEILQSNLNINIKNIFDTQIANAFVCLEHHISYKNLVKRLLNKDVKKDQQHSNWIKRPLTQKQINYAGRDVIYLQELFDKLYKSLLNDNKLDWFKEEMENILQHINSKSNVENLWKKIRLDQNNLLNIELLKELSKFREEIAQNRNKPKSWILKDKEIIFISKKNKLELYPLSQLNLHKNNKFFHIEDYEKIKIIIDKHSVFNNKQNKSIKNDFNGLNNLKKELDQVSIEKNISKSLIANKRDLQDLLDNNDSEKLQKGWRYTIFGKKNTKKINLN